MGKVVSKYPNALEGRQIPDAILIDNEAIDLMQKMGELFFANWT